MFDKRQQPQEMPVARRARTRVVSLLPWLAAVAFILLLWHFLAQWRVLPGTPREPFPGPLAILSALLAYSGSGELLADAASSVTRVAAGYLLGSAAALAVGLASATVGKFAECLARVVGAARSIPPIAWIPVAIIWFSSSDLAAVFIVSVATFFPVLVATRDGLTSVDEGLIRAARTFGARRVDLTFSVLLPAAAPQIFTGLRIGLGISWTSVIASELIGAMSGLGYHIQVERLSLSVEGVVAGMIAIAGVGLVLLATLQLAEWWLLPWRRRVSSEAPAATR